MSYNLFLDDQCDEINLDTGRPIRDAEKLYPGKEFIQLKTVADATNYALEHGCPEFIAFDHDLAIVNGKVEESIEFIKWLINHDLDNGGSFIPDNFSFHVHSANPRGRENITGLLGGYLREKNRA